MTMLKKVMNLLRRAHNKLYRVCHHIEFAHIGNHSGYDRSCVFLGACYMHIGDNTNFGSDCQIIALESHNRQLFTPSVIVGSGVHITQALRLTCVSRIEIGDNCLIAPNVFITDHNHGMDPTCEEGYASQPLRIARVRIGRGVWLGQNVCVLPGVNIGEHCIVGAGSIVTHNIPDYTMAAGVPARVIKRWDFELGMWVTTR